MLQNLRVLVVDDQESMRMLVISALRAIGIQNVASAENGEMAIPMLQDGRTSLVLLDVEMPRMDGVQTLAAIRHSPKTAKQPVMMMTGRSDSELVQKIAALKVSGYLIKPISAAKLKTGIDKFLAMQAAAAATAVGSVQI